ncbi:hypothetical protein [Reyranella sp.]|uniref:hypothetical protein n=1 Tax=Reyranella sp. TaxID=1929291 RepID=UPI003BA9E903
MTRPTLLTVLFVCLACSVAAQTDDAAYCRKLSEYATRYMGDAAFNGGTRPDFDIMEGTAKCNKGDTAGGIAILEKKIRSKGFTPPPR